MNKVFELSLIALFLLLLLLLLLLLYSKRNAGDLYRL